jgi:nucleotide-binding universal stress UspA family protein
VKKILWPVDFSYSCNSVLPYVCGFAQSEKAEVVLLYVAQDITDYEAWYGELDEDHARRIQEWEVGHANRRIDDACDIGLSGCPSVKKKVVIGDPLQEILKTVKEEGIDLVILASRGRGADKRGDRAFGGVADKVIKNSPVPVMIVNPPAQE